jgi:hypothetical protein
MAKIKDEQLQKMNELRGKYNELVFIIGQNQIRQKELKLEEESMYAELEKLNSEEQIFFTDLQTEYGDGNLDTTTGEFTPKEQ